MPIGSSRLGFRFINQGRTSTRVLCFYDPYTPGAPGGNTNYYSGGDVNPSTAIYPVIRDQELSLGNQPELIVGYGNLPADLSIYGHLWDIGYASPYIGNDNNPTTKLFQYLQGGGAMCLLGENSLFGARDDAIDTFVNYCGGGTVLRSFTDYNYSVVATVEPEFLLANNNNSVTFSRPGTFTNKGTGTAMSTAFVGTEYPAVCWKTGSLTNAPLGAITAVLDINIFNGITAQPDFIDNLSLTMNRL